jgi:hypothetical protein
MKNGREAVKTPWEAMKNGTEAMKTAREAVKNARAAMKTPREPMQNERAAASRPFCTGHTVNFISNHTIFNLNLLNLFLWKQQQKPLK